ncbi:MAG: hypothetical protein IH846_18010, partial [Acidobacteria bacterium]|nr:hypothetical protein [Acidobacteriota bacterium]
MTFWNISRASSGLLASFILLGLAALVLVGSGPVLPENKPAGDRKQQVLAAYGKLPLSFEENLGQTDPQVKFLSRGSGYTLFLTPSEAVLAIPSRDPFGRLRAGREEAV